MSILFKKVQPKDITKHFLDGYIRYKEVTKVLVVENNELVEKEEKWVEEWDQTRLEEISLYLQKTSAHSPVFAAFDKERVVGFANLDGHIFYDEYINMSYLHASQNYRNQYIGKKLFYLICLEAKKKGASKLYLSAIPDLDSQMFYKGVGCVLTQNPNPRLVEIEPYDIQMEKLLDYAEIILNLVDIEFKILGKVNASTISKVASKIYKYVPKEETLFLNICKELIKNKKYGFFSVSTLWLKRNKSIIKKENITFFEEILVNHIYGWAEVDQYCYRVLNPMIELDESFYLYLDKWSQSGNKDVRRASLVAMIRSSQRLTLHYDYNLMITLVNRLYNDEDFHVRKGVGWTLKCAFPTYPKKVEQYLRDNVKKLDRMVFRYALEHVPNPLRQELMNL